MCSLLYRRMQFDRFRLSFDALPLFRFLVSVGCFFKRGNWCVLDLNNKISSVSLFVFFIHCSNCKGFFFVFACVCFIIWIIHKLHNESSFYTSTFRTLIRSGLADIHFLLHCRFCAFSAVFLIRLVCFILCGHLYTRIYEYLSLLLCFFILHRIYRMCL